MAPKPDASAAFDHRWAQSKGFEQAARSGLLRLVGDTNNLWPCLSSTLMRSFCGLVGKFAGL